MGDGGAEHDQNVDGYQRPKKLETLVVLPSLSPPETPLVALRDDCDKDDGLFPLRFTDDSDFRGNSDCARFR